jgi:hypothetical protein
MLVVAYFPPIQIMQARVPLKVVRGKAGKTVVDRSADAAVDLEGGAT